MNALIVKVTGVLIAVAITFALAGAYNSTSAVQRGFRGVGMDLIAKNKDLDALVKANAAPPSLPPASQEGQLSVDAYKNVQVLGHITSGEMTRLMTAMTIWVAPQQGCAYCHAPQKDASGNVVKDELGNPQADQNNLHSDDLYTKRVARRMLQMTMHINSKWKSHVKETGVTCYSCHRGNPVPSYLWYDQTEHETTSRALGDKAGQNMPSWVSGLTSMAVDPFGPFLKGDEGIRIISTEALPIDNRASIKQTEWTYSLMMHISRSLGVNCTHCHNTRSMADWTASPVPRNQAWYGIRMVRDLNQAYLDPLSETLPADRIGPAGDAPKSNCMTCHQGAYRPLLGASMLKDYMVLAEAKPQPQKTVAPAAVPDGGVPTPDGGVAPTPDGGTPVPAAAPPVPGAAPTVPGVNPTAPAAAPPLPDSAQPPPATPPGKTDAPAQAPGAAIPPPPTATPAQDPAAAPTPPAAVTPKPAQ